MQHDIMIENQKLQDVNPLVCGRQNCVPGHQHGPAVREFYLLHYVMSGRGVFQSPRGSFAVASGQMFIIRPGEVCIYSADENNPWHYAWVGFSGKLAYEKLLVEDVIDVPECAHIFEEMAECGSLPDGREWYICGKIYELLAQLRQRQASPGERGRTGQYVNMAQNYIRSNYMQTLRVDQLAAFLNLDRSYFSQIFKRQTGKSPQQYIVDFRLQKAAEMMVLHRLRPGEAAQCVGYTDIVNFSRMFRRKYGMPPGKYREHGRQPKAEANA